MINVIIEIDKNDYKQFAKFINWLELLQTNDRFNEVITEWGVSHSTFEQVFLKIVSTPSTAILHTSETMDGTLEVVKHNNDSSIIILILMNKYFKVL